MYVKEQTGLTAPTPAAEFVEFFAEAWRSGGADPERFFAEIGSRMTPTTRLVQPLARTVRGPEGLRELFTPLFAAIPDLRSRVERWGATEDGVLIEHTLHGTLGGRPINWSLVDRFILRDGFFEERRAYFDPLPLALVLLSRPRASFKLLPAMFKRRETK